MFSSKMLSCKSYLKVERKGGVLTEEERGDSGSNVHVLSKIVFPTHLTHLLDPPLSQPPLAAPLLLRPLRRTPPRLLLLVSWALRAPSGEPLHGDRRSRGSETHRVWISLGSFLPSSPRALCGLRMERPLAEKWMTAEQR